MTTANAIKLKVCGMRDAENILAVARLLPAYMGFIFYRGSRRFVGEDFVVPEGFPSSIERVGVFVNETPDEILRVARKHQLSFVQLHGDESVAQCNLLRGEGLSVIKAFSLSSDFDFSKIDPYKGSANYFLFDTKGKNFGGNGIAFDWEVLRNYDQKVPFFLSGGISNSNVKEVNGLKGMNLHALDLNSGVEKAVGIKDVDKIRQIEIGHWKI